MQEYQMTVGLEIHAELKTKSKMFCGCKNDPHRGEPNEYVCPVCMGHPGTLPTINKKAVKHVLTVGVAVGGNLATYTEFDRKNYFYPDIPKGYQISQYAYPLVDGGELCGIKIERVHLEEDTARSQHLPAQAGDLGERSLIDYNRASVPLMELVTEPVIHDAKVAGDFARELQLLLRTLDVSDANMEKGEMRVEANISVSKTKELGTKVEVKNLNSFKAVESAIEYEVKRHIDLLEREEKSIVQETRGWDENKGKTFSQRIKETAHDYRYFPDPDLPKLNVGEITDFSKSRLKENMNELPHEKRLKYNHLGLPKDQIEIIISNPNLDSFFNSCQSLNNRSEIFYKTLANYLTSDILGYIEESSKSLDDAESTLFTELIEMVVAGEVTSRVAKNLIPSVVFEGKDPHEIAKNEGLIQDNSEESLLIVIKKIISENPNVVSEYKEGKTTSIEYFVGLGMKETRGTANPVLLRKLFGEYLAK